MVLAVGDEVVSVTMLVVVVWGVVDVATVDVVVTVSKMRYKEENDQKSLLFHNKIVPLVNVIFPKECSSSHHLTGKIESYCATHKNIIVFWSLVSEN